MKKVFVFLTISVLVITALTFAFVGCNKGPQQYADLVAVRVNNRMAEWENPDYNFTYEGSNKLTVKVPYTNYLQFSDLIVSPNSTVKVYEDEGMNKEIADNQKIYTDGDKTMYIKVINGDKENSYQVCVQVRQDNLPPQEEIASKQYDNRAGHVYIAPEAETIMLDGVEYTVLRGMGKAIDNPDGKFIVQGDLYHLEDNAANPSEIFNIGSQGIFDANCYVMHYSAVIPFFNNIEKGGVLKNAVFELLENCVSYEIPLKKLSIVCENNYGLIDNVKTDLHLVELGVADEKAGEKEDEKNYHEWSYFAHVNEGEIKNCMNAGLMETIGNPYVGNKMSVFATVNSGKITNCVNTGKIDNELWLIEQDNGACAVAYESITGAQYQGVYNLAECTSKEKYSDPIDKKLNGYFMKIQDGQYPDMSKMKNYTK